MFCQVGAFILFLYAKQIYITPFSSHIFVSHCSQQTFIDTGLYYTLLFILFIYLFIQSLYEFISLPYTIS